MSLDLIPSIPPLVTQAYKSEFFSQDLIRKSSDFNIRLIRLYLGRELPAQIQELQPGLRSDLALDVGRYTQLAEALELEGLSTLPPLDQVAHGMGKILAQLHFGVGVDGMDVELVMCGGGQGDHGLQCHILDYNQCQRWLISHPLHQPGLSKITINDETLSEGAIRLARRIGNCEHYYPKPSQDLFQFFRNGYASTVSALAHDIKPNHLPTQEEESNFEVVVEEVIAAGDAFLKELERVGLETAERKARTEERQVERVVATEA
jgi:hypothetical protein